MDCEKPVAIETDYCHVHDAWYVKETGKWVEGLCGDEDCLECKKRTPFHLGFCRCFRHPETVDVSLDAEDVEWLLDLIESHSDLCADGLANNDVWRKLKRAQEELI